MSVLSNRGDTLLEGLSSFWHDLFANKEELKAVYRGTEELLGQAYLDMVTQVLNVNVREVPVFNKEYWNLFVLDKSQFRIDHTKSEFKYYFDLDKDFVDFEVMYNKIYNPSVVLTEGIDFKVEPGKIFFDENIFENTLEGVPKRTTPRVQSTIARGRRGVIDENDPYVFTSPGRLLSGNDGQTFGNDLFRSTEENLVRPLRKDHRRVLRIHYEGDVYDFEVVSRLDEDTIRLDSEIPFEEEGLSWSIINPNVFDELSVGNSVRFRRLEEDSFFIIREVIDGNTVRFNREFPTEDYATTRLEWSMGAAPETEQYSLWVPDALFDRENLYKSFGCLVGRKEPSSEEYRALLKGIMQFFMLGPSFRRIESALNVMVGVPASSIAREVVREVNDASVVTSIDTYEVPDGSAKDELQPGQILEAFEPLTDIFKVEDSQSNPTWFNGLNIPEELLESSKPLDRSIDPDLYEAVIGEGNSWRVGDRGTFIGADYNRDSVYKFYGNDGYIQQGSFKCFFTKFRDSEHDNTLVIDHKDYNVNGVNLSGFDIDFPQEVVDHFESYHESFHMENLDEDCNVYVVNEDTFVVEDEGVLLKEASSTDFYKVEKVYDARTILLSPYMDTTSLPEQVEVVKLVKWKLRSRPPLKHNLGYNLAKDYLSPHICFIQYKLFSYGIENLKVEQDIRDVIREGLPSHVYAFISSNSNIESKSSVSTERIDLNFSMPLKLEEKNSYNTIGDHWHVGGSYALATSAISWTGVIRIDSLGEVFEINGSEDAKKVHFQAMVLDEDVSTDVEVYYHNGDEFVFSGQTISLAPDVFEGDGYVTEMYEVDAVGRTALKVVSTGPDPVDKLVFVQYGVSFDGAGVVSIPPGMKDFNVLNAPGFHGLVVDDIFSDPEGKTFFHPFDVYREVLVSDGDIEKRFLILSLPNLQEAVLADPDTIQQEGLEEFGSELTFKFGTPKKFRTPYVLGSANPQLGDSNLRSFPLQVTYKEA